MNRKFTERPILFSLAAIGGSMLIMWLFLTPIVRLVPFYFGETVKFMATLLVVLGICQECFGGIPFSLGNRHFAKGLFTAGSVGLICAAAAFGFTYQAPERFPGFSVLIGFVLCCAAAAVSEEFLFRGLILTVMKKCWSRRKAIVLCSLLFGLRHLLNLIWDPSNPITTLGQVFFAFLIGIYLCAVYERTRNLRICIGIHFLQNFCSGFWSLFSPESPADTSVPEAVSLIAVHFIYLIAAHFLLKPRKA